MTTYKELLVWQRGIDLVEKVYDLTKTLPFEERYGISSQLQRAAISVPANVAEGHGRRTTSAYINHVSIAIGSVSEVETLLEVCRRVHAGDLERLSACSACASEVGKMLYGLHRALERSRLALYSIVLLAPFVLYIIVQ